MAKQTKKDEVKKETKPGFGFDKISSLIQDISTKTAITIENDNKERSYISTGIYILDALLSKSLTKGGIPKNRITIFAGPPQTGKSFILYNIARNAQKEGYSVLYIDTEFSIEKDDLQEFGVDTSPDKFMLLRSNKVEDLKVTLTQLLDKLKTEKRAGKDIGKFVIMLDSIGQLASAKEIDDALEGKDKVDMTRAKAIKSFFRIINSDLGFLDIPLVCTNHTYSSMDLFPKEIMSGGKGAEYSASTIVYLSIAKLKTGEEESDSKMVVSDLGSSGIVVTAKASKNRMAKPMKVKFEIDHKKGANPYKGIEYFCTPDNFDTVGIAKVKEEVDKSTGEVKYTSSAKWLVKHMNQSFYEKQLHQPKIFTHDVMMKLEPIVKDYFSYAPHEQSEDWTEMAEEEIIQDLKDDGFEIDDTVLS